MEVERILSMVALTIHRIIVLVGLNVGLAIILSQIPKELIKKGYEAVSHPYLAIASLLEGNDKHVYDDALSKSIRLVKMLINLFLVMPVGYIIASLLMVFDPIAHLSTPLLMIISVYILPIIVFGLFLVARYGSIQPAIMAWKIFLSTNELKEKSGEKRLRTEGDIYVAARAYIVKQYDNHTHYIYPLFQISKPEDVNTLSEEDKGCLIRYLINDTKGSLKQPRSVTYRQLWLSLGYVLVAFEVSLFTAALAALPETYLKQVTYGVDAWWLYIPIAVGFYLIGSIISAIKRSHQWDEAKVVESLASVGITTTKNTALLHLLDYSVESFQNNFASKPSLS